MAHQIMLCFDPEHDLPAAREVARAWRGHTGRQPLGLWPREEWRRARQAGEEALHSLIDADLECARVVVVLVGGRTAACPWVRYTILAGMMAKRGLLGLRVHTLGGERPGPNPFEQVGVYVSPDGYTATPAEREGEDWLSFPHLEPITYPAPWGRTYRDQIVTLADTPLYDWKEDLGETNLPHWVDAAARSLGG